MNSRKKKELLKILTVKRADTKHPLHVTWLSEKLFDDLKPVHQMGDREKEYLVAAAMLHDIGFLVSVKSHHKHSANLILNLKISDTDLHDRTIIANIARYHRKSMPSFKHQIYNKLSKEDKKMVSVLASILRIADGLDRTHLSIAKDVKVKSDKRKIRISYVSDMRSLPEEEAAVKKSDLLESIFKRKVVIGWEKN